MKKSSMIILGVCLVLMIYFITIFISVRNISKPDFTQNDAQIMLDHLGVAFGSSSVEGVMSFASPDAKIAGKQLDEMRVLLQRAFRAMHKPKVIFKNLDYVKHGDTVNLGFEATVQDEGEGPTVYSQHMGFVVRRREVPRLFGLLSSIEWKIVEVDAPNLPSPTGP